jgi:hypothetical protein
MTVIMKFAMLCNVTQCTNILGHIQEDSNIMYYLEGEVLLGLRLNSNGDHEQQEAH